MDRRWQLVLDCLDCDTPPFRKGTLVAFRQRLIARQLDRRLLERTVEIAATSGAFAPASCGRRWTVARCGALDGWKIPLICWVMPCARLWA